MYGSGETTLAFAVGGHPLDHHHHSLPTADSWSGLVDDGLEISQKMGLHNSGHDLVPYPSPPHSFGRSNSDTIIVLGNTGNLSPMMDPFQHQIDSASGPIRNARRQTRMTTRASLDMTVPLADAANLERYNMVRPPTEDIAPLQCQFSPQQLQLQPPPNMSPPRSFPVSGPFTPTSPSIFRFEYGPRSASPTPSVASAQTSVSSHPDLARRQGRKSAPMTPSQKDKTRKQRLFDYERKSICELAEANPGLRQEDIAQVFSVERSTISKVLKDKKKWLALTFAHEDEEPLTGKGSRSPKFTLIETQLLPWVNAVIQTQEYISDNDIRDKALEVARNLCVTDKARANDWEKFKASPGWIENFRSRHKLKKAVSQTKENKDLKCAETRRSARIAGTEGTPDDEQLQSQATELVSISPSSSPSAFTNIRFGNDKQNDDMHDTSLSQGFNDQHHTADSDFFGPKAGGDHFTSPEHIQSTSPLYPALLSAPHLRASFSSGQVGQARTALSFLLDFVYDRPDLLSQTCRDELSSLQERLASGHSTPVKQESSSLEVPSQAFPCT